MKCFCFQDSPRRAHSHRRPGRHQRRQELPERRRQRLPSVLRHHQGRRLPRPRSQRLSAGRRCRVNIIDQCVAQGVPFAREYGGLLDNRSFGGAQVSRTFYARGQTGQQLLLGAYQALSGRSAAGKVKMYPAHRDARPGGRRRPRPRHRRPRPGDRQDRAPRRPTRWCWRPAATATSSISRPMPRARNVTAIWRAHQRGALFANPCFTQIHPTCIPVSGDYQSKLTLMCESLRNDGRIWVPKKADDHAPAGPDPGERSRLLPGAQVSQLRQPGAARRRRRATPRGVRRGARRRARRTNGVYLDFARRHQAAGQERRSKSATATCSRCTRGSPAKIRYEVPMRIYPAPALHHGRAVGGLQPDEQHPGPVRRWARPTSPTTAPTAWAPAP